MRIGPLTSILRRPQGIIVARFDEDGGVAARAATALDLAHVRLLSQWEDECEMYGLPAAAPLYVGGVAVSRRVREDGIWGIFAGGEEIHAEDGDLCDQLAALDMRATA
jgi:hypothetical protein